MSQPLDMTPNVDELRDLILSGDGKGHDEVTQDGSQRDTQQDTQQDNQQDNEEDTQQGNQQDTQQDTQQDNQQARQEYYEENDQEQDQQCNDHNGPHSENDPPQVYADIESSIRVPTRDSTGEPQQLNTAETSSNEPGGYRAKCEDIIRALRRPTPDKLQSPLLTLKQQIEDFFQHGPERATGIFLNMLAAAESGLTKALFPDCDLALSWKSCKASATLVGLLACPPARVNEVLEFLHYMSDHLELTIEDIEDMPSNSLQMAFLNAKALALGEKGLSTVIMVSLADVCHFRLAALDESGDHTSFAHAFVLGIGPEGVVTWQSWAEHGYSLDQWIDGGGTRVGTWQQAGDFVDYFENFAAYKGKWDDDCNKLYEKLFDVYIVEICGPTGPSKPIVPTVDPWVRLLVMEDVKLDHLYKFTFE